MSTLSVIVHLFIGRPISCFYERTHFGNFMTDLFIERKQRKLNFQFLFLFESLHLKRVWFEFGLKFLEKTTFERKYNLKFIRAMFYPQVWLYSEKGQFNVTVKCKTNISMVTLAMYGVRIIVAKRSNAFIYSHDGWVPFSIAKQLTSGSL